MDQIDKNNIPKASASPVASSSSSTTSETITTTPVGTPYTASQMPEYTPQAVNTHGYSAATLTPYQAQTEAVQNAYNSQLESQKLALQNAYNQSRTEAERQLGKIPESYDSALNNQAAQYERQRRNFAETAAANGLGSGAGSQANLAMNVANQGNMASINKAKADAITDAQNKITDLHTAYQNSVAEAIAQNNYEQAVQMLQEYRTQAQSVVQTAQAQADEDYRQWQAQMALDQSARDEQHTAYQYQLNAAQAQADEAWREHQSQLQQTSTSYTQSHDQAALLAQYGDFSGYASLYGQQTADNMKQAWAASNPDLAYNTGAITADQYHDMTGQYPAGYSRPSNGYGQTYINYTAPTNPTTTPENRAEIGQAIRQNLNDGKITTAQYVNLVQQLYGQGGKTQYESLL